VSERSHPHLDCSSSRTGLQQTDAEHAANRLTRSTRKERRARGGPRRPRRQRSAECRPQRSVPLELWMERSGARCTLLDPESSSPCPPRPPRLRVKSVAHGSRVVGDYTRLARSTRRERRGAEDREKPRRDDRLNADPIVLFVGVVDGEERCGGTSNSTRRAVLRVLRSPPRPPRRIRCARISVARLDSRSVGRRTTAAFRDGAGGRLAPSLSCPRRSRTGRRRRTRVPR
jgi:hypothetical protein